MTLTEKLIGKQLNDAVSFDPTLPGIQTVPVVIETAVAAENSTAIIVNGRFTISYDEAQRIAKCDEEVEILNPLSEVSTRAIVDELITRQIYKLCELKERRYGHCMDVSTKLEVSELLREIEMLITMDYSNYK